MVEDAEALEVGRDRGHVCPFVLPADDPAKVQAPNLFGSGVVAQGFERDRKLDRPAVLEPRGSDVPHRAPGQILPRFGYGAVALPAKQIRLKQVSSAPVIKRIDEYAKILVLQNAARVPPHFVGDHAIRLGVPVARGDIQVVIVEKHPGLGPLGAGFPVVGFLLDEPGDREDLAVVRLVQAAVHVQIFDAHGPDRDAFGCAQHGFGRLRNSLSGGPTGKAGQRAEEESSHCQLNVPDHTNIPSLSSRR